MIGPEKWESNLPIMEEAQRIKGILLPLHIAAQEKAAACEDSIMGDAYDVRSLLGYPLPEDVDLSSVIDVRATKHPMLSPRDVALALPLSERSVTTTHTARTGLAAIHSHRSPLLAVSTGECGVRDPEVTLENAERSKKWQATYQNLLLLLRVFLEKPRTPPKGSAPNAWKGFIYDPRLDGSNDINLGVVASRMIICRITDFGVPIIKEQLNPLTAQYTDGAITQDNTGARNARDQATMELMAGSSAVVGNKNPVEGDKEAAIQASTSVQRSHSFIGVNHRGNLCVVAADGNPTAHIVLRGGKSGKNFYREDIAEAKELAREYGIPVSIDVDASHENSASDHTGNKEAINQLLVINDVCDQIADGERAITGVQMETNIVAGKQSFKIGDDPAKLEYAKSITDECLGPDDTEAALAQLDEAAAKRAEKLSKPVASVRKK